METNIKDIVPRPYQAMLEEIAYRKNTIIHLPTGSGKTFIAINLIKRYKDTLKKPWNDGGKRTFFLVNTVPLVKQQKKVIEDYCLVSVGGYSGEDLVDFWKKEKWDLELTKHEVIVMTTQILADMLTHNYIYIKDINLLIFDECHHAIDDHPMRLVMKHFENCDEKDHPRILGLTATLLNSNVTPSKVKKTLRDLETTFHATIATVNELGEVLTYSTNPHETVQYYQPYVRTPADQAACKILDELSEKIMNFKLPTIKQSAEIALKINQRDISSDPKKIIKAVKNMVISIIEFIDDMGTFGASLAILAYIILIERLKRKSLSKEEENLYHFVITYCLKARMILLQSMTDTANTEYEKIVKHSSKKVLMVLNVLKEYDLEHINKPGVLRRVNRSRKPLSAIIFAKKRFTSKVLYNFLKAVIEANQDEFSFIKHDFIVGFNINPYKNTREETYLKKCSHVSLLNFKNKELNCLISTSVIEEGVDIPQCSLVLRYDEPMEYRSYIQSKGRARNSESSYVMLVDARNKAKFEKKYDEYNNIEKLLQEILVGQTDSRDAPTREEINDDLYEDDDISPFTTPLGSRLFAVSAISLLNRYCSMLPHDQFTTLSPMWIQELVTKQELKCITVIMPLGSPVKEGIKGDPYLQLKNAKRSAALKACIRLYEEGELDPITLLPRSYGTVDFSNEVVKQCFLNWPWGDKDKENATKDSQKTIRKHRKVYPTCLDGPKNWTSGNQKFHLHIIKLKAAFDKPTESRDKTLYELLHRPEGFGLITSTPLPKICDFPTFLTVGEATTSLETNYAVIPLGISHWNLIKRFHYFVFDQVLGIAQKFVAFDGTVNAMYVVPIMEDNGFNIDWQLMQQYDEIPPITVPTYEERRSLKVNGENYLHKIVSPWYRGTILPDRYMVTNVLEYMTPNSKFDTDDFKSYAHYYSSKYNLDIVGKKDQPLLEVRNITTRMNCLLPRAATIHNEFSVKQQKLISEAIGDDRRKNFVEILVPEFCTKYDFPGILWYKAMMLPSILHRVTHLLIAFELRATITKDTKYGDIFLSAHEKWQPIEVDDHATAKAMLSQIETTTTVNAVDRMNMNENPRSIHVKSMKQTLYMLQKHKLNKDYPWDERSEPLDIERNITTVTALDIECYDEFMSIITNETLQSSVTSPPRPNTAGAILAPPLKKDAKILLLSKKPVGRGPELRDILSALTTIKSHDTFNLERAETLGDSFLKFAATLYLFHKFPKLREGQLTNIKGRLIGNRNLYYAAEKINLAGRMKVQHFSPRKDFTVPGFFAPKKLQEFMEIAKIRPTFLIGIQLSTEEILSGKISEKNWAAIKKRYDDGDASSEHEPENDIQAAMQCYVRVQAVRDKTIADCVEALIGTYLLSGGVLGAVKFCEWLKIIPPQDNFASYLTKKVPTVISEKKATENEIDFLMNNSRSDVEDILQYKFKDPSFILEALTHPSYIRNRKTNSYERLEFLGDAILDFLITTYIFENYISLKPGDLTDLRSALVNNVTFASYVVKLGLHKVLCSQLNPVLDSAIMAFVDHQTHRNHEIVEDVLYLIDEEDCNMAQYVEVPKVLSDIFESLMGAIFLDSGGDLQAVWTVVYRIMCQEIASFSARIPLQPVRALLENIHACAFFGEPTKTESNVCRMMVPVTFSKLGLRSTVYGFGANKHQARRAAAKLAMKILAIDV